MVATLRQPAAPPVLRGFPKIPRWKLPSCDVVFLRLSASPRAVTVSHFRSVSWRAQTWRTRLDSGLWLPYKARIRSVRCSRFLHSFFHSDFE